MTAGDAVVILIGLAMFVLILRWGPRPGRWIDGTGRDLDWMIERVRELWQ